MNLLLNLTVQVVHSCDNVPESWYGAIRKVHKQWNKRLYHLVTSVMVLK